MKGTLSSTRIRPQTYSIRGEGRPAFPPRVSPCLYRTYSVRDSARNSTSYFRPMPLFGNAGRLPPFQSAFVHILCSPYVHNLCSHPLTPESCSASMRPMAKARKPTSSSARRSKGTARSQSKSQKKKTFPPPPPAQRGGVELVDRARMHLKIAEQRMKPSHEQNPRTADEHYQRGVAMMNIGRWDDARESLDKARKAAPKADHIHYALAALDCL